MNRGVMLLVVSMCFLFLVPVVYAYEPVLSFIHPVYFLIVGLLFIVSTLLSYADHYFKTTGKEVNHVTFRDGALLLTFLMGIIFLFPSSYIAHSLAVPFLPLSMLFLGFVIFLRLVADHEDLWVHFWDHICLFVGLVFYLYHLFVHPLPAHFSSLSNPNMVGTSLLFTHILLGALGVFFFVHSLVCIFSSKKPKKDHPHGMLFQIVSTLIVLVLVILFVMIALTRLTGRI
jgi:hypothetical protein